jgi:hypothetical protein
MRGGTTPHLALGAACLVLLGFVWPWKVHGPWPQSSDLPVAPLGHPRIEERLGEGHADPGAGFRFAAYGDQRALADGEWQTLVAAIAALEPAPHFVIDTGDIVDNGEHSDQFAMLAEILAPIAHLPYLVAVGNHELHNNEGGAGRANTAACLGALDPEFGVERMYYRKDLGPVSFIFLDTNDWVYGDDGEAQDAFGERGLAQLRWLQDALASVRDRPATVVVMHHPFLQSSRKHREASQAIWSIQWEGVGLAERFLEAGVDLVLAGHTHTYERFRLELDDGRAMTLINLSGRPRSSFLWFGDGRRRARDIAGRELEWLADKGWADLAGWRITQEAAMVEDESNQFGLFTVDAAGGLALEMVFLDDESQDGQRREARVVLHRADD